MIFSKFLHKGKKEQDGSPVLFVFNYLPKTPKVLLKR
jgi:hypothetical protein